MIYFCTTREALDSDGEVVVGCRQFYVGYLSYGMNACIGSPGTNKGDFLFWVDKCQSLLDVTLDSPTMCLNLPAMKIRPIILNGQLIFYPRQLINFGVIEEMQFR